METPSNRPADDSQPTPEVAEADSGLAPIAEPVSGAPGTKKVNRVPRISRQVAAFSGPIPPPEFLRGYEDVLRGAADRILAMAERQAAHRQGLENRRLDAANLTERTGQFLAFLIAMLAIGDGIYLVSIGKDGGGLTAIIAALASLVGIFFWGQRSKPPTSSSRPPEPRSEPASAPPSETSDDAR